jgi:hypothetical protein
VGIREWLEFTLEPARQPTVTEPQSQATRVSRISNRSDMLAMAVERTLVRTRRPDKADARLGQLRVQLCQPVLVNYSAVGIQEAEILVRKRPGRSEVMLDVEALVADAHGAVRSLDQKVIEGNQLVVGGETLKKHGELMPDPG